MSSMKVLVVDNRGRMGRARLSEAFINMLEAVDKAIDGATLLLDGQEAAVYLEGQQLSGEPAIGPGTLSDVMSQL